MPCHLARISGDKKHRHVRIQTVNGKHILRMSWVSSFPSLVGERVDFSCTMVSLVKGGGYETVGLGGIFLLSQALVPRANCGGGNGFHA